MNVLDLFSGIGGFSLGLERAGMRTVAFCESDRFCRRVLTKHWLGVRCYHDVRSLTAEQLHADGIAVDLICGGFPCVDISVAGKGAGIDGEHSGLWKEFARLIGEVRPRYAIVENTAALLGRGLARILGDLAALGFSAEWHCIRACDVGAPHIRDRCWIMAYADSGRREGIGLAQHGDEQSASGYQPDGCGARGRWNGAHVADAGGARLSISEHEPILTARRWTEGRAAAECGFWRIEPDVGRVAFRLPKRVDRLRSLGNSLVPQIPEILGRAIMSHDQSTASAAGQS